MIPSPVKRPDDGPGSTAAHAVFPPWNVSAQPQLPKIIVTAYYCYLSELIHKNSIMNHGLSLQMDVNFRVYLSGFSGRCWQILIMRTTRKGRILNDLEALASRSVTQCVNQMEWNGLWCGRALAAITQQLDLTAGPDLLSWKIKRTKGWRQQGPFGDDSLSPTIDSS